MNNDENIMYALRNVQAALEQTGREINVLVEQIGSHTVVSSEFVLPEYWHVENCPEATEWAKSVCTYRSKNEISWDKCKFIMTDVDYACDCKNGSAPKNRTQITQDQFITHVYNPWKESLKPRYFKCISVDGKYGYDDGCPRKGVIYPANHHEWGSKTKHPNVEDFSIRTPSDWQPATESEYLAQEAAKQPEQGAPFDEVKTQLPNYDISNVTEPKFKVGDRVICIEGDERVKKGAIGTVQEEKTVPYVLWETTELIEPTEDNIWAICNYQIKHYSPPKFDPTTADKTKMYFAVHNERGEGIVHYDPCKENWQFIESDGDVCDITYCTHIDHEPIQRRN